MRHANSDPSNSFHELRRYLLARGLDTRPLTNQDYPRLINKGRESVSAYDLKSLDNALFFMLRKVYQTDSMIPVPSNVFIFRVFFPHDQDNTAFVVQICLCHHGNGLYEMNPVYDKVLRCLKDNGWNPMDRIHNTLAYDQLFMSVQGFKLTFQPLYEIFREHDLLNNHLISVENSM